MNHLSPELSLATIRTSGIIRLCAFLTTSAVPSDLADARSARTHTRPAAESFASNSFASGWMPQSEIKGVPSTISAPCTNALRAVLSSSAHANQGITSQREILPRTVPLRAATTVSLAPHSDIQSPARPASATSEVARQNRIEIGTHTAIPRFGGASSPPSLFPGRG